MSAIGLITNELIEILHTHRKKVCTCGRVMMTPAFHDLTCPYLGEGEDLLRMHLIGDQEKGEDDHEAHTGTVAG